MAWKGNCMQWTWKRWRKGAVVAWLMSCDVWLPWPRLQCRSGTFALCRSRHASLYLVECKVFHLSLFSLKIWSCCTFVKKEGMCKKVKCNWTLTGKIDSCGLSSTHITMGYWQWVDMYKRSQSKHNTLRFWLIVCAYLVAQHTGMTSVNIDMSINHTRFLISNIFLLLCQCEWCSKWRTDWKYSCIDTLIYVCISRYTQTSQSWTSCRGVYSVFPPHWCCLGGQWFNEPTVYYWWWFDWKLWIRRMVVHIKF